MTCGLDREAPGLLQRGTYDLLLGCSSVPQGIASELISQARKQSPKMYVVRLVHPTASAGPDTDLADDVIISDFHPQLWVNAVDRLLGAAGISHAEPSLGKPGDLCSSARYCRWSGT